MSGAIVTGSIAAVAGRTGKPIAETMLDVTAAIFLDCSGSMASDDSVGGRTRHAVAVEHLTRLQAEFPGKIALIAFSSHAQFMPGGVPPQPMGGTGLDEALKLGKQLDGLRIHFFCVSDGYPSDPEGCIRLAKTFASPISTVYVGPEDEKEGQEFLKRLAAAAGGTFQEDHRVSLLADKLRPMLTAGVATPA